MSDLLVSLRNKLGLPLLSDDNPYSEYQQRFLFKVSKTDFEFYREHLADTVNRRGGDASAELSSFARYFDLYHKHRQANKQLRALKSLKDESVVVI